MLKKIYIDNYKCLVNFELELNSINLFLGENGSGKSCVFEVLRKIQDFVVRQQKISEVFFAKDLTRWQTSNLQTFELEIEGNGGIYKYELEVEYDIAKNLSRVNFERLWFNQNPLLKFEQGEAQLYHNDYSEGPKYPFDWTQSELASLPPRSDNTKLIWFKDELERFIIVQIDPLAMEKESLRQEVYLSANSANFVSWYRNIYEDQGIALSITEAIREILEGFQYFKFDKMGESARLLKLSFKSANDKSIEYGFGELSSGERALIVLYSLLYYAKSNHYTLCIDEPANFLALPEIQPWLVQLYDFCGDGELQTLLISHHPELINYLAVSVGFWFVRKDNRSARVNRITESEGGLPISELVVRGWINENG